MTETPEIALIHATRAAITPVETELTAHWPDCGFWSLLDEGLAREMAVVGEETDALKGRIEALADHAVAMGCDGILFTCSAFSEGIEAVQHRLDLPVLKPNEALIEDVLSMSGHVGLVATHPQTLPQMAKRLEDAVTQAGTDLTFHREVVEGAWDALQGGEADLHDALVRKRAKELTACDAVVLAQFSMAPLAAGIEDGLGKPVLTAPKSAVAKLKRLLA